LFLVAGAGGRFGASPASQPFRSWIREMKAEFSELALEVVIDDIKFGVASGG
jgi:hypothetical protein